MSSPEQMHEALKQLSTGYAGYSGGGVHIFAGTIEQIRKVEEWHNAVARCEALVETIKQEREQWAKCDRELQEAKAEIREHTAPHLSSDLVGKEGG